VFGKEVFAPDKLLKAARAIIGQKCLSWECVELMLRHDKKPLVAIGGANVYRVSVCILGVLDCAMNILLIIPCLCHNPSPSKDIDMILRVAGVKAVGNH
jgi:hypothetical protein